MSKNLQKDSQSQLKLAKINYKRVEAKVGHMFKSPETNSLQNSCILMKSLHFTEKMMQSKPMKG